MNIALPSRRWSGPDVASIKETPVMARLADVIPETPAFAGSPCRLFEMLPGVLLGGTRVGAVPRDFAFPPYYCAMRGVSIGVVLEGTCEMGIKGVRRRLRIGANACFLSAPFGRISTLYLPEQPAYGYMGFFLEEGALARTFSDKEEALIRDICADLGSFPCTSFVLCPEIAREMRRLLDMAPASQLDILALRIAGMNVLAKILRMLHGAATDMAPPLPEKDRARLFRLKDHIDRNFCDIATARELVPLTGISEAKTNAAFKRLFSVSVSRYLRQCKMSHAHQLLASGESNVSEAAVTVGYTNISHFIRAFRETYGVTPKKLRLSLPVRPEHSL